MGDQTLRIERVHELVHGDARPSGALFLVDRLWPRGVSREDLSGITWVPEVAPSPHLRTWFGHDSARWEEFRRRYRAELDAHPEVLTPITTALKERPVTLLYAASDTQHNHARVLREYLAG